MKPYKIVNNFIELNSVHGLKYLVNINHITDFFYEDSKTYVCINDRDYPIEVKESYEDIRDLIISHHNLYRPIKAGK